MRRPHAVPALAALVVVAMVLAAACGSSGTNAASTGTGSSTTRPSPTSSAAAPSSTTSTVPAAVVEPAVAPVSWHTCTTSEGPSGYQCATVTVPLNPSDPGTATLPLAIDRHVATGTSQGSLLVNPGGPGASGVDDLPQIVGMLNPDLTKDFDIVGFDPPGVGHSDPVTCEDTAAYAQYLHLDPAPPTPAGVDAVIAASKTFAQGCEAHSGAVLPYVSTVDAARDMDLIRQALGQAKLNYLGFSYGTFLGSTYAELFGSKIRAMVLDGAIDPAQGVLAEVKAQAVSFDSQFTALTAACAASSSCPWRAPGGGTNLVAAFQTLLTQVRAHPLMVGDRSVGPSELIYGTADGLYNTQNWTYIDEALAEAQQGNGQLILNAFDDYVGRAANGTYSNALEAEEAVNCLDDPTPSVASLEADKAGFEAAAPVFGLSVLYGELGCTVWPVPATGGPHLIHAPQAPTIVVVGSTGDPATPYPGAQHLAAMLDHGVLLTRDGGGHTGYGASSCIRQNVDTYLITLTPPAKGTVCPSDNTGTAG